MVEIRWLTIPEIVWLYIKEIIWLSMVEILHAFNARRRRIRHSGPLLRFASLKLCLMPADT